MGFKFFSLLCVFIICVSCHSMRNPKSRVVADKMLQVNDAIDEPIIYNPSKKRINDLIHTKLDVKFDWQKMQLIGKATLTLKPFFYPTSTLVLDAKGFELLEVSLISGNDKKALVYTYDKQAITIKLDKEYRRDEPYSVYIDYIAKPNDLPVKGSEAISETKGLYFINPDGKEKDKPMQIWTQGETESSSCWFPTIDATNERMTQEIYMTVDTSFTTLSNGLLEYSQVNGDGTRTDYWKQSLAAAPYLTMMAVGKYAVVKDKWRGIEVNYYVEPEYEKYAKMIFGNTPEMLEYFSTRLGVPYPWEKYSQIVVRDYVSGAMENTTATVHGEFIQRNDREYLDQTNEEVISHELFHHWFGDLVTCESWANLPLNESFATYGEYLWNEKKYGSDEADYGLQRDLNIYLQQSKTTDHELIWFYHKDKEDMFDDISYQKGSRILHMLRNYVGDEAFFSALKIYLTEHKFNSVEAHDLRLAFEQVTGEDLNWFFNQWFFKPGHPELDIRYSYNDSLKRQTVSIKQASSQQHENNTIQNYKIPLAIDIYANGKKERHSVVIEKANEEFFFDVTAKPDLVNVDADKMLLCVKKDVKPNAQWAFQYNNAPKYMDRYEAIKKLGETADKDSLAAKIILKGLDDPFWNIRSLAVKNTSKILNTKKGDIQKKLIKMAQEDPKSLVRAIAIDYLVKDYEDTMLIQVYKKALEDKSYSVVGSALEALAKRQPEAGLALAKSFETEKSKILLFAVAAVYADYGKDEQNSFFETTFSKMKGVNKYLLLQSYGKFLLRSKDETINKGLIIVEDLARNGEPWWVRLSALQTMTELYNMYEVREKYLQDKLNEFTRQSKNPSKIISLETDIQNAKKQKELLKGKIDVIKALEQEKPKAGK